MADRPSTTLPGWKRPLSRSGLRRGTAGRFGWPPARLLRGCAAPSPPARDTAEMRRPPGSTPDPDQHSGAPGHRCGCVERSPSARPGKSGWQHQLLFHRTAMALDVSTSNRDASTTPHVAIDSVFIRLGCGQDKQTIKYNGTHPAHVQHERGRVAHERRQDVRQRYGRREDGGRRERRRTCRPGGRENGGAAGS